ncbi:MAG: sigma-70 family RNA polymerase sigma factor [Planctomycetota bacterium]
MEPHDRTIVQRVLAGDRDAFRHLVREHGLMVRSYIGSQVHHMDDVDDLAQDVFLAAYRKLEEFDPTGDFGAWLRGIARMQVLMHFRAATRRNAAAARFREEVAKTLERELDEAVASESSFAVELLLHCIGKLPERMRRVVRAGLDGLKPSSLAEELSTTVGAVYNLHYRANALLRECMKAGLE